MLTENTIPVDQQQRPEIGGGEMSRAPTEGNGSITSITRDVTGRISTEVHAGW